MKMKIETRNEYEKAVNQVIDYINRHLYDSPDLKKLSEIANISEFHFHRIFKAIIGENVGEFVARLRMEDIAQCLRMTNHSLTTIATQKGYATKYALSKAFKKHFGISPSGYRALPQNKAFFDRGDQRKHITLSPDMRTLESKNVVYIRIIDWYGSPDSYTRAWKQLGRFAWQNHLINDRTEYIGLSFDDPTITPPESCRFYACFTVEDFVTPTGPFGLQTIGGGLYAVFLLKGAYDGLLDLYCNIYLNWLPYSGYRLRKMYAFEKYLNNPTSVDEENLLTEVFVPVEIVEEQ